MNHQGWSQERLQQLYQEKIDFYKNEIYNLKVQIQNAPIGCYEIPKGKELKYARIWNK